MKRKFVAALLAVGFAVLVLPTIALGYTISGNKFVDTNADGVDAGTGDPGLNGVTIYADLNNNDVFDAGEPSAVTAGTGGNAGNYTLTVTNNSAYTIREVQPAGYVCSAPGTIGNFATCEAPVGGPTQTTNITGGPNFGNFQPVSISGLKFNDLNGNGVKDAGEGGISGVTIYLDANNNDAFDAGETSTTTAADGTYSFAGLKPGTYTVREVAPVGSTCTAPSSSPALCEYSRTLTTNGTSTGNNFGNASSATISGTKFEDLNANGIKDAGEPPIQGVTVYLDANGNNAFDVATETSTTTDASGNYSFSVGPGTYTVREVLQAGYSCSTPSSTFTACEYTRTVTGGGSSTGNDFGNYRNATISGTKFEDLNANGIQDGSEGPLAGVVIYLDTNGDNARQTGGSPEPSTTTDASGNWSFAGLKPGTYSVREVLPTGYVCTAPSSNFLNCEFNLTVASNETSGGHVFGNVKPASISGNKFEDLDADGIKDAGEGGISGVTIYLDGTGGQPANDSFDLGETSTTTAGNGNYSFTGLLPGTYTVREVAPLGYECSAPGTIGDFSSCEFTHTVIANQAVTGDNFGNFRRASISGLKFEDLDGSGTQEAGELPIQGVQIYLDGSGGQPANDSFDAGETTTTTAADGTYSFTNLIPGNYTVREEPPTGFVCTAPSAAFASCEFNFTPLTSGTNSTGNNFGNAQPGSISGTKFADTDGNGVQDAGEGPLSGVTIYLDANNNDVFDTGEPSTTTDLSGNWSLTDIAPGSRTIREVEPAGYACTAPSTTFANCEFTVSLTSGGSISAGAFGNALAPTLSGSKFADSNANGTKEGGELPISGVTIYLDANNNDAFDAGERSTTTDINGDWSFSVLPGNYTVREVPPAGSECSAPGTIGDASTCEFNETLVFGTDSTGHDFGNFSRVSISGTKFEDLNGNGTKSGTEPFLSGVTIYLDGSGGQPANDSFDAGETSTTTNASGAWSFTNLIPGSYTVREEPGTGYQCSAPGTIGDFSSCEFNLTLTSGQASTGNAFGNYRPATISGTKFEDTDADGVKDAGEPPLANVTIYDDANGNNAFDTGETSTLTAADGTWSLSIAPGGHTIREVLPAGYECSVPSTNFANCEFSHTVTSNQTVTGDTFGNFARASISGTKFEDLNADGVKDAGEPPLTGVTIYLDLNGNNTRDTSGANAEPFTTTDASGNWSFTGLKPGDFTVREVLPTGYECSAPSTTFADCEFTETLSSGENDSAGQDFGNFRRASIAGTKFEDLNADGVKDAGEPPLSGVTIYLDGTGGQPANDSFDVGETSITTAADGTYSLTNLKPGNYTVREVVPATYECSLPTAANNCEYNFTPLTSGTNSTNNDFGNFRRASIAGTKFEDLNADGVKDAGEPPIQGVTVYLDTDGSNTLNGTETSTTTAADGTYSLPNLKPGNYTVREEPGAGYECSAPGTIGDFTSCEYTHTLTSNQSVTGDNFGNFRRASISGTKFADLNADGVKDAGEPPIQGVTVYLDTDGSNTLNGTETSTTTAADGTWSFTNLIPGSYTVREEPPAGYACTAPSTTFANCEFTEALSSNETDSSGQDFGNAVARDLSITKTDNADPVLTGASLTYTITVTNNSTLGATGVTVTDPLPAGTTFSSASAGCTEAPVGTVTCNIGPMAGSGTATVTITVTVPNSAGTITNTASVQGAEYDQDLSNNSASQDTTVNTPGGGGGTGGGTGTTGTVPPGSGAVFCFGKKATIIGTSGADTLKGTPGPDVIAAGAGADKVNGAGGNDLICGQGGKDLLKGAAGNDKINGGAGRDTLKGGPGKDKLKGGPGLDKLIQ